VSTFAIGVVAAGADGGGVGAGRISAVVLVAVLIAACAHAAWNAIAHGIDDKFVSIALVNAGSLICAVPLVLFAVAPQRAAWGYLAVSVVLHVLYNAALMLSYRLGDFSQTYPLARGTSPLVVTGLAAVFAAEIPTMGELVGVALICGGLAALVFYGRRQHPIHPTTVFAAVGTGVLIAAYTVVDGIGIRQAGSWLGYVAWLMLLESGFIPVVAIVWRRRRLIDDVAGVWRIGLIGGALSVVAYGLVLWAQTRAPLAPVAALRESSIVMAAIIGTVVFGERFGKARILTTACVAAGIAVMYLT
jgi:drug/metabolite transporter (DMT)-like permease